MCRRCGIHNSLHAADIDPVKLLARPRSLDMAAMWKATLAPAIPRSKLARSVTSPLIGTAPRSPTAAIAPALLACARTFESTKTRISAPPTKPGPPVTNATGRPPTTALLTYLAFAGAPDGRVRVGATRPESRCSTMPWRKTVERSYGNRLTSGARRGLYPLSNLCTPQLAFRMSPRGTEVARPRRRNHGRKLGPKLPRPSSILPLFPCRPRRCEVGGHVLRQLLRGSN